METEKILDKDGYILIPKEFTKKSFTHVWVKDLPDNWKIYKRFKSDRPKAAHFELVHCKKSESYIIAGVEMPKKWNYPSAESWGKEGFTLETEEDCIKKYNQINNIK